MVTPAATVALPSPSSAATSSAGYQLEALARRAEAQRNEVDGEYHRLIAQLRSEHALRLR